MVETVLSVLIIASLFLALFKLSYMLHGKIMLEHAAMRTARARAVGFNDFMCRKAARVATIPVAGKRLWPLEELSDAEELSRIGIYMGTPNDPIARGVLEYEGWGRLGVRPGDGTKSVTSMGITLFGDEEEGARAIRFRLDGEAGIEDNFPLYMYDQGLQ